MTDNPSQNPYLAEFPPFAGRQTVFARLHQNFSDALHREATLVIGQRQMGKTALLRQFPVVFDETFINIFFSLRDLPLKSEGDFLRTLFHRSSERLGERGFTLSRLTDPPDDDSALRAWLADDGMAKITTTIRPHRRLIWLFDDADCLLNAVGEARLSADLFSYLYDLLSKHRQLQMVFTIDAEHEAALEKFTPLVNALNALRLTHLSAEESADLLRQPVQGMYTVSDDAAAEAHRATGGHPLLLQRLCVHLFRGWEAHPDQTSLALPEVKAAAAGVYTDSEAEFRRHWQTSTPTERLILTAISSLLYDDPLRKIETPAIQSWLVETDYPTDSTAINAALRSLEYREILNHTPNGITLRAGLMQKWLVENARLHPSAAGDGLPLNRRTLGIVVALVVIVVLALVLLASSGSTRLPDSTPQPTATLVTTPTSLP